MRAEVPKRPTKESLDDVMNLKKRAEEVKMDMDSFRPKLCGHLQSKIIILVQKALG